jgi:hypothetical protein
VARLPRRLRRANVLVAHVDYSVGDAEFGVDVKRVRRR